VSGILSKKCKENLNCTGRAAAAGGRLALSEKLRRISYEPEGRVSKAESVSEPVIFNFVHFFNHFLFICPVVSAPGNRRRCFSAAAHRRRSACTRGCLCYDFIKLNI